MQQQTVQPTLSVLHLVAISFFLVSAGPFGQEEAIRAGGALYTFIATLLIPLLYALPLALMSSEQASRLPVCGGAVEWGMVLGKFVGWSNAYLRFLRSVSDNALYPVMTADYLCAIIPQLKPWYGRLSICLVANAYALVCNITGLDVVGWASLILSVVILSPFVLFVIFAAKFMSPSRVFAGFPSDLGSPDFGQLLSVIVWQFSGFDTVAAVSAETANPRRTFPIAMLLTVLIVTLVYLLPSIAAVSVEPDISQFESGFFSTVVNSLPYCASGWLSIWISVAGAFSSLSLLNVALSCTGREVYASARIGAFPLANFLGKLDSNCKNDALPIRGVVFMSLLTVPFTFFGFSWLVAWTGVLTIAAQLVQCAVFCALRVPSHMAKMARRLGPEDSSANIDFVLVSEENLEKKFVIPGGWPVAIVTCVAISAVSIALLVFSGWVATLGAVALVVGMFVIKGIEVGVVRLFKLCRPGYEAIPEQEALVHAES
jgi:amino acid transporter